MPAKYPILRQSQCEHWHHQSVMPFLRNACEVPHSMAVIASTGITPKCEISTSTKCTYPCLLLFSCAMLGDRPVRRARANDRIWCKVLAFIAASRSFRHRSKRVTRHYCTTVNRKWRREGFYINICKKV
ncbi:uncharacterized protein LOC120768685 [Bactrocera tryoni]|uniref:uncharacterized protein LOC120768685 n=1 Tax=Bactrocera tryoni TaxID=59916 RepID=UPI001A959553|nr:uncharacterized protein LOC120768685 [Bactrocera tryoni]